MKKALLSALGILIISISFAQQDSATKKDWSKVNIGNRDHLLIQLGHSGWQGAPDSMSTKGLSRQVNVYFMMDFPFKTDPRISAAIGVGVGTENLYFKNRTIDIAGSAAKMRFRNVTDTSHFKKFKLGLTYAEVPLELRYSSNPEFPGKSFKFAIGGKIGTMLNAHTKGKNLLNKAGSSLNAYTVKESSKKYFNTTRFSATARVGYGSFSLYGNYQVTSLLKDGAGPVVHPYGIGLTISGL